MFVLNDQLSSFSWNKWETTNFGDGEKNEKFRRLMGIKSNVPPKAVPVAAAPSAVLSPEEQVDSISIKNVAKNFYENFNDIV